MGRKKKSKFYAVSVGRKPGIYRTWSEAETQVLLVSGNLHEAFPNEGAAKQYLSVHGTRVQKWSRDEVISGKSNGKCWYCGTHLTDDLTDFGSGELEHQTPKSRGGGSTLDNLVLSCRPCNEQKSDANLEEFRAKFLWAEGCARVFCGENQMDYCKGDK